MKIHLSIYKAIPYAPCTITVVVWCLCAGLMFINLIALEQAISKENKAYINELFIVSDGLNELCMTSLTSILSLMHLFPN